ncbi:MAG: DUF4255 domain-containing protein [Lewinellaceae bacterium]|nr:DUF4255 domain-containing protein [Lewinellaceae bacterium]MCB9287755.1 DUF4255 domain-containing protein [Lewinellaceae bacterium]
MIFESLSIVRDELAAYIRSNGGSQTEDEVILGNVASLEGEEGNELKNKIIMSLVNVEEESTLKNVPAFERVGGNIEYRNPAVYLNVYLLFCANYQRGATPYEDALKRLSHVIQFVQGKNVFTIANSPNSRTSASVAGGAEDGGVVVVENDVKEIKLILDLYTLTFEQINHLWGSLGGKQIPFVMYKGRLVKVREPKLRSSGPPVYEVHSKEDLY